MGTVGDGFSKSLTFGVLAKREAERAARQREEQREKETRRRRRRRQDRRQGGGPGGADAGGDAEGEGPSLEEMEKRAVQDVREGVDAELEAEEMQLYESCFLAPAGGGEEEGGAGKGDQGDALPPWLRGDGAGQGAGETAAHVQNSVREGGRGREVAAGGFPPPSSPPPSHGSPSPRTRTRHAPAPSAATQPGPRPRSARPRSGAACRGFSAPACMLCHHRRRRRCGSRM